MQVNNLRSEALTFGAFVPSLRGLGTDIWTFLYNVLAARAGLGVIASTKCRIG